MAQLTADRNTPEARGAIREGPVAAGMRIFAGALLMRDASGDLTPGATATGAFGIGRAEGAVDNTGGGAGQQRVRWRAGIFAFANSGGADALSEADIGQLCYIVDDQTVAATDGGGTRSPAGTVDGVTGGMIWVRFDEALTRAR